MIFTYLLGPNAHALGIMEPSSHIQSMKKSLIYDVDIEKFSQMMLPCSTELRTTL